MKKLRLKQTLLAVPAAALMLGSSFGGQVGINFQTDFSPYTSYSGKPVTATAFGIDPTNWVNFTPVPYSSPSTGTQVITLSDSNTLTLAYSVQNGWTSGIDADGTGTNVPPGQDEVFWGYLDDSSPGFVVKLSGFREFAAGFTVQTISASDGASGFANINLTTNGVLEESLNYTNDPSQFTQVGGAGWGISTVSAAIDNNSITLQGAGRVGTIRNTLAGIILTYTTPAQNPPIVEINPAAPTNIIFSGQSFTLTAAASGSPVLYYQWQLNSNAIAGATGATFTNNNAATGDSGSYDVVVSNAYGVVTSAVIVVPVLDVTQPTITQGPVSETLYPGYPAAFTVQAAGGQLSYQWQKGITPIPNATNATLSLTGVTTNDAGTYTVTVSNPRGNASASAVLTIIVPTAAYPTQMASLLPYVYYRFSESGPLAFDEAVNAGSLGSAGNGNYLGGSKHPYPGALAGSSDTAASFDGVSGRVSVPFSSSLNTAPFTAEAWLNPAAANTGTTLTCAYSCGDFGSTRAGWLIYQGSTGWDFRMYNQLGTATALDLTGGGAPVPGKWYHVAVTFDGTIATLYVNGQLTTNGVPTSYVPGTAGPLAVGCRADSTFFWNGAADEAAYYSSALSAGQILAHYQNGGNAARGTAYNTLILGDHPVEYLRLDEPQFYGNTLNLGTSGPLWNGTESLTGTTDGAPGPQPPGYTGFEANNLAVQVATGSVQAAPLNLSATSATMLAWINLNGDNTSYFPGIIFSRPSATGLGLNASDGLAYNWNNDAGAYGFASGLNVPPNEWCLAALVVTPTNATLYLGTSNGLRSAVNTHAHQAHDFTTAPLVMGFDNGNYLNAQIDEAAVFPYALSQSQITALYTLGFGVPLTLSMTPGGVIVDSKPVGTPNYGYDHGAAWLASSGPDGNGVTRTGVEQFVATNASQIIVPASPNLTHSTGTIAFWMNYPVPATGFPGSGNEAQILFDCRTTAGTIIGVNTTGGIEFQTTAGINDFTTGYVVDGNWHHIALTYDQSASGTVTLYIDGTEALANQNTTNWAWPANQELELGRSHDPYWYRYDGQMDDFRIYNRILTPAEVATIGTFATSDNLIDTSALQLRYNFDNVGIGDTLTWPFGVLRSTTTLNSTNWPIVTGATSPFPFLPTGTAGFFRTSLY
ncbi:MAG TPA: LamG-like jellyroll fold domain-containing protein [Verrucomicrobiae bacterium]